MTSTVLERIVALLESHDVSFRQLHHVPTPTSEDAARERGEPLEIGGKAIVMKTDADFRLFVLSAVLKVDSQAIRKHLGVKKTRFASREELLDLTGLVPGCVPPFGKPLFDLDLFVDESIFRNQRIAFNAGSLTDSIIMSVEDYARVAEFERFSFAAPA